MSIYSYFHKADECGLDRTCPFSGSLAKEVHEVRSEVQSEKCKSFLSNVRDVQTEMSTESILSKVLSPVGKLRSAVRHWEDSGACNQVLEIIRDGYKLPFKTMPSQVSLRNNKSARENPEFVMKEIHNLLLKKCISETPFIPNIVNPLTVAINIAGKLRLVLDCRHINPHLFKFKCCYEDQKIASELFEKGDFLFTFDLRASYHHIEIFQGHRTYLGFQWTEKGITKYYVFNVLAFGLSTAGYIFTKVLRTVIKSWRAKGKKVITFLDDGIGGAKGEKEARKLSCFVREDIQKFGFLLAEEKCMWDPSPIATWLGHVWNMFSCTVKVTDERIEKLDSTLDFFIKQVSNGHLLFRAKQVAGLVGQIISMQTGIGPLVRLRTRALYSCLLARASWDSPVMIQLNAYHELNFWKENLKKINGRAFIGIEATDKVMFSDASGSGFGGFIEHLTDSELIGSWSEAESAKSSTWRELEAVRRLVEHSKESLEGQSVVINTDSKNVSSILNVGSRVSELHESALKIHGTCRDKHINLIPRWIARQENKEADYLSRCSDSDDWAIQRWVFNWLDTLWGPHTYDRFASDYNTKCKLFSSRWWCPGTAAIDAFSISWNEHNSWLVPPPRLISKCLKKLVHDGGRGTLIDPKWLSAPFWPLFYPDGKTSATFIVDSLELPQSILTAKGRGKNGVFGGHLLKFKLVAFRINGKA